METIHKNKALKAGSHVDNDAAEDKSSAVECDPWNPPFPPYDSSTHKSFSEWRKQRSAMLIVSRATNIIIPDRTPKIANSEFYKLYPDLLPILEKDSAQCFLRLYADYRYNMARNYIIIPEVLNQMIVEDALNCAKVVLEGKAPVLEGFRANPNCMNQYGYFPLHEATERFSVEMIKLLLHHGALTNLRTAGDLVIEGLLPLHVAVEDTCLHKYLQDNLLPNQEHPNHPTKEDANFVYKIIYLLCLPEMKIFLNTTRLLSEHTNNLVEEVWNYIKDGKLLQTAVLLLAAQAHIHVIDGFSTIITRIAEESTTIKFEISQDEKEKLDLEAKCQHLLSALLLVQIIDKAGNALDLCIQRRKEVAQTKVLERVSQILNGCGFFPTGGVIRIGSLCPYEWSPLPGDELPKEDGGCRCGYILLPRGETPHLCRAYKSARRFERECTWNNFFPYWRSVLAYPYPCKFFPAHAQDDVSCLPNFDHIHNSGSKSFGKPSSPVPNGKPCSLPSTISQVTSMHQSRRLFGTVALTILKVLKNA
ncbi:uncharacterized protein [Lolium perenne]|uniref:uncharacterized protein n=1 Tax=Lolium perenne TaxID=4522 RepID=UPI0021F63D46|nr:uncharacterized protein LOC127342372 isoform X1 [Lolium perenne]